MIICGMQLRVAVTDCGGAFVDSISRDMENGNEFIISLDYSSIDHSSYCQHLLDSLPDQFLFQFQPEQMDDDRNQSWDKPGVYDCQMCGQKFSFRSSRNRHMRKVHKLNRRIRTNRIT